MFEAEKEHNSEDRIMAGIHLITYAPITVTTTAAPLFTSTEVGVTTLILQADAGNGTDIIYVGDPSVDASNERGLKLAAGAVYTLRSDTGMGGGAQLIDLTNMWADASAGTPVLNIVAMKQA